MSPVIPMHDTGRRYIKASDGDLIFTYASYGNFIFPAAVSLKMNVEPVYESSNRLPKWWKHTFTIETVIDPSLNPEGDTTTTFPVDLNMSQVRRMLSLPGQPLVFWNLGIGQNQRLDLRHASPTGSSGENEPAPFTGPITGNNLKQDPISGLKKSSHYSFYIDNLSDLNFGPRPQLLVCEPIGGSRAFRVAWTVECALPSCCVVYDNGSFKLCNSPAHFNDQNYNLVATALGSTLKITEFNYSMSWAIDDDKFTTYTIVGTVEFAGQLFSDNAVNASSFNGTVADTGKVADALALAFYLRPGFKRNFQYDLSRDKRRIEFRITDTEIPSDNPYYPGIKSCTVRQSISGNPMGAQWNLSFSGDFEVQPGVPKYWGLVAFVALIQDRLKNIKKIPAQQQKQQTDGYTSFQPSILPTSFSFDEDIYSRKTSFNFSFKLISPLNLVLSSTRMFTNTPGSWAEYRRQMYPINLDLKGSAQIRTINHEPLITVCRSPEVLYDVAQSYWKNRNYQGVALWKLQCPEQGKNIIDYEFTPELEVNNKIVPMRPASWSTPTYFSSKFQDEYQNLKNNLVIPKDSVKKRSMKFVSDELNAHASEPDVKPLNPNSQQNPDQSPGPNTHQTTFSGNGPSEYTLRIYVKIISLCWDIRAVSVRKVISFDLATRMHVEEVPRLKDNRLLKRVINNRSDVPIKAYYYMLEYKISNPILGDLEVSINSSVISDTGETLTYDAIISPFNPNPPDDMGLGTKPIFDSKNTTTYTDAPPDTMFNVPFLPGFGPA